MLSETVIISQTRCVGEQSLTAVVLFLSEAVLSGDLSLLPKIWLKHGLLPARPRFLVLYHFVFRLRIGTKQPVCSQQRVKRGKLLEPGWDIWPHPASVWCGKTETEHGAPGAPSSGHGKLPTGCHGGRGAGWHVWHRPTGGRRTSETRLSFRGWGESMRSSPIGRGGVHHPGPAGGLWNKALSKHC